MMGSIESILFTGESAGTYPEMAGINIERATTALSSPEFIVSAGLVVAGSLFAQLVVSQLRNRVYDVQFQGGDAMYAGIAAFVALVVLPGEYGRPLALGSTAAAIRVILSDYGVV
jgi:hypothetical protein